MRFFAPHYLFDFLKSGGARDALLVRHEALVDLEELPRVGRDLGDRRGRGCGLPWRPAVEPTVGVAFLPGFKNEPEANPADEPTDEELQALEKAVRCFAGSERRNAGHALRKLTALRARVVAEPSGNSGGLSDEEAERGAREMHETARRTEAEATREPPFDTLPPCCRLYTVTAYRFAFAQGRASAHPAEDPELGGPGGFGVDPEDSRALLRLRQAIDDHLGWRDLDEEEAGDYVARVVQVGAELKAKSSPGEENREGAAAEATGRTDEKESEGLVSTEELDRYEVARARDSGVLVVKEGGCGFVPRTWLDRLRAAAERLNAEKDGIGRMLEFAADSEETSAEAEQELKDRGVDVEAFLERARLRKACSTLARIHNRAAGALCSSTTTIWRSEIEAIEILSAPYSEPAERDR